MPRLSDLLSDNLKKQLLAEAAKKVHRNESGRLPLPVAKSGAGPVVAVPAFVAIDVETTGLDFSSDRVIEVGAVKFINGKPGDEFSTFVNSGMAIPPAITDLTGISGADVATAPAFSEVAPKLLAFLGDLPLCGHQIEFDLTFLNKELERAGAQSIGKQSLDTALLSKILLQAESGFSLKAVSETLSVTLENAHRALNDAKASGEVAVALLPKIAELPIHVRQTIAAAAPASYFKTIIFRSLGTAHPRVSVRTRRGAAPLPKLTPPDKYREINREEVKNIFSEGGSLQKHLESYSSRKCQIDMALEVADALNTQSFLVAEAGTGTGKSLAYLLPAAMWGMANATRLLVATRTKNLQDQLTSKELPLISGLLGGAFRYSVLKGRSNYLCLNRLEKLLLGEYGNLSQRERFAILPLIPWVESTATGDIEEQNQFNPKWFHKLWDLISAESYGYVRRRCPFFKDCFLQQARQKALSSHIVVINHALFFSETVAENSFLGKIGSIVFDEAHHLESSGHRHLRVELDTNRVARFLEELNNLVQCIGTFKETSEIYSVGKEIKSHLKQVRKRSQAFLQSISDWAGRKKQDSRGIAEYQIPFAEGDFSGTIEAPAFENTLDTLKDLLYRLKQTLAGPAAPGESETLREDAQSCLERASQLSADLRYLVAAKTEDHAFWIEGNLEKGWTKLCGVPLDVAGLLSNIWAECSGSVIFTSATLSVARSVDYFLNSAGLAEHKARTAVGFFPSPFGAHQAVAGAIKSAPDPDDPSFPRYVSELIGELHGLTGKNILVLFTANSMLGEVHRLLRADSRIRKQHVLAQGMGSGGRHALLEQFKRNQSMILLGADSFWEGIDAPGESCEIVIIPRLPFPVPTHPLNLAIQRKMESLHGESFMSFSIPEAVIRFRQGAGRLIRAHSDRGALIVLDNRIVNKGYGKQFIRSLDAEFTGFADKESMLSRVLAFFAGKGDAPPATTVSYIPFDEV